MRIMRDSPPELERLCRTVSVDQNYSLPGSLQLVSDPRAENSGANHRNVASFIFIESEISFEFRIPSSEFRVSSFEL